MTIDEILIEDIEKRVPTDHVAVCLSGGVDSLSLAFAAQRLGKKIIAHSFRLDRHDSYDFNKAQEVAKIFGWEFVPTIVPTDEASLIQDLTRLVDDYDCVKKTHTECSYPFLYMKEKFDHDYVLNGIGASAYLLSRKGIIYSRVDGKIDQKRMDEFRSNSLKKVNPSGVDQVRTMLGESKSVLVDPYLTCDKLNEFFFQCTWEEMHKPVQKRHVREAFAEEFQKCGKVKEHLNLQLDSEIDTLFETLLNNPKVNYKNRTRVMDLIRDWSNRPRTETTLEDFFV